MIWIADGAKWIATQILDYYHCKERLCQLATEVFHQPDERKQWVAKQEDRLFNDQLQEVLTEIDSLPCRGKALQLKRSIQTYNENNHSA